MSDLLLNYPALTEEHGAPIYERIRAELRTEEAFLNLVTEDLAVYELRAHAIFIPLAPGDIVLAHIESREIVSLVAQAQLWTVDADFMLPANLTTGKVLPDDDPAKTIIREVTQAWQREAWVTQHGGFSFYVSAQDRDWLEDRVMLCQYVDHVELVRYPGMKIDLDVARGSADLGDLTKGPWS